LAAVEREVVALGAASGMAVVALVAAGWEPATLAVAGMQAAVDMEAAA